MNSDPIAKKLEINGIVQGVGFRPFVYQLAKEYGIKGEVANTSSGVFVHLEGDKADIDAFCADLSQKPPPLARITGMSACPAGIRGFKDFLITGSRADTGAATLISPDMCVCEDCVREMSDPKDRRYHYAFVNCTNCGPRYTIISDLPYDRPNTSMRHFGMCERCQAEYDDPGNRRFHAQPNACGRCGPQAALYDNTGERIQVRDPVEAAADILRQGHVMAIKGLGGFHLAANAENTDAVLELRKTKHREEKPFAIMSCNMEQIVEYAFAEPEEERLLLSPERPIVLLEKKEPNPLSNKISLKNKYVGVMLPYTPLHYLLLNHFSFPKSDPGSVALVMTSGNMTDEPIAIDNRDAFKRLSGMAEYFLVHDRDVYVRCDDSVVRWLKGARGKGRGGRGKGEGEGGGIQFVRRSRGYVPGPVFLKKKGPQVLACGADMKNTVCLTRADQAFLSQHIGDLKNFETYAFFKSTIGHIRKMLDIRPEIIVHDLHPDYLSTRYAQSQKGLGKIPIQHHHAHIVSCIAEHHLKGPVIGLAFDGTGYGTDGNIWGGEVLISETGRFARAAHLAYTPMPGGSAAIKAPWRMAVSYLYDTFGQGFWNLDLPLLKRIDEKKIGFVAEMTEKRVNAPYTSSLGRFFDGVAGIMGIRDQVSFEGQAGVDLEMLAEDGATGHYDYEWTSGDIRGILFHPIVRGVVEDVGKGVSSSEISAKFHKTLVCLFSDLCQVIRKESGLNHVALSGGVFQNMTLLTGLTRQLTSKGFRVFTNSRVPPNDGGISLGQAVAGAAMAEH